MRHNKENRKLEEYLLGAASEVWIYYLLVYQGNAHVLNILFVVLKYDSIRLHEYEETSYDIYTFDITTGNEQYHFLYAEIVSWNNKKNQSVLEMLISSFKMHLIFKNPFLVIKY